MTGRIIHHRQSTAAGKTVSTDQAGIAVAFHRKNQAGFNSRIIRKFLRIEFLATMSAGHHHEFSR